MQPILPVRGKRQLLRLEAPVYNVVKRQLTTKVKGVTFCSVKVGQHRFFPVVNHHETVS